MYHKFFLGFALIFFASSTFATNSHNGGKIPFIVYKPISLDQKNCRMENSSTQSPSSTTTPALGYSLLYMPEETLLLDGTEIEKSIREINTTICKSVENADVTVWFSANASGKVLGIGASANSGIKITFHCGNSKSK